MNSLSGAMKRLCLVLIFLLMPSLVLAAGTVTQSISRAGRMIEVTFSWTADAGAATVPSTAMESAYAAEVLGCWLISGETDPGATAPTDDYDIVVNDSLGCDLFGGALNNRDTSTSEYATPLVGNSYGYVPITDSTLTMVISNNAVNSATGKLVLRFYRP